MHIKQSLCTACRWQKKIFFRDSSSGLDLPGVGIPVVGLLGLGRGLSGLGLFGLVFPGIGLPEVPRLVLPTRTQKTSCLQTFVFRSKLQT